MQGIWIWFSTTLLDTTKIKNVNTSGDLFWKEELEYFILPRAV